MAAKKRNRRTGRAITTSVAEDALDETADLDPAVDAEDEDAAEDAAPAKGAKKKGSAPRPTTPEAAKDPVRKSPKDAAGAKGGSSAKSSAEAERSRTSRRRVAAVAPNPAWLAPFAVTMLIVGLVYLVTYYLSAGQLPLPIGDWNLAAGFGIMVIGGGALMFWK